MFCYHGDSDDYFKCFEPSSRFKCIQRWTKTSLCLWKCCHCVDESGCFYASFPFPNDPCPWLAHGWSMHCARVAHCLFCCFDLSSLTLFYMYAIQFILRSSQFHFFFFFNLTFFLTSSEQILFYNDGLQLQLCAPKNVCIIDSRLKCNI